MPDNKTKQKQYIEAVGRRRRATARVRFYPLTKSKSVVVGNKTLKKGSILVNGVRIAEYFPGSSAERSYSAPLRVTHTNGKYAVSAKVSGGGKQGQLNAFIHGAARVLSALDRENNHQALKKRGFLTRDPRAKERRKAGLAQKARAKKQSPKR